MTRMTRNDFIAKQKRKLFLVSSLLRLQARHTSSIKPKYHCVCWNFFYRKVESFEWSTSLKQTSKIKVGDWVRYFGFDRNTMKWAIRMNRLIDKRPFRIENVTTVPTIESQTMDQYKLTINYCIVRMLVIFLTTRTIFFRLLTDSVVHW